MHERGREGGREEGIEGGRGGREEEQGLIPNTFLGRGMFLALG